MDDHDHDSIPEVETSYSLSLDKVTIDEGDSFSAYIQTTNLVSGTTLYYAIKGDIDLSGSSTPLTAIDLSDFDSPLTGSVEIDRYGKASFTNKANNDLLTEGSEFANIRLYSDSQRTLQVAAYESLIISDTSTTEPTYSFSDPDPSSIIDETSQSSVRFNISTTDVDANTRLYYTVSHTDYTITSSDFSYGDIKSSIQTDAYGKATFDLNAAADKTTEGWEAFNVKLYSDDERTNLVATSSNVAIRDTSKSKIYSLSTSSSTIDEEIGNVVRFDISTTNVYAYTPLYYTVNGSEITSSDFSYGDIKSSITSDEKINSL